MTRLCCWMRRNHADLDGMLSRIIMAGVANNFARRGGSRFCSGRETCCKLLVRSGQVPGGPRTKLATRADDDLSRHDDVACYVWQQGIEHLRIGASPRTAPGRCRSGPGFSYMHTPPYTALLGRRSHCGCLMLPRCERTACTDTPRLCF
jgi:hypothetical protein